MFTNRGLVEYVKKQVGNPYIYGTFGQLGNSKLLATKHEQYPSFVTTKRVEIVRANPNKYYGKPWHDCAGLIKGYLMQKNLTVAYNAKYDLSANAFYNRATRKGAIGSIPEIPGLGLWKNNHVGIYLGGGRCIQAKGFDYGVVESDLRGFTNWFEVPYVEYDSDAVAPTPAPVQSEIWIGQVVTNRDPLNIRPRPDFNNTPVGVLPKGSTARFDRIENGFAHLADGRGWCSTQYIKKV